MISKKIHSFLAILTMSSALVNINASGEANSVKNMVINATPAVRLYNAGNFYLENRLPIDGMNKVLEFTLENNAADVLTEWKWNYALCKKTENKFTPERIGGQILNSTFKFFHLLSPDFAYKGTPIVDEYLAESPFFVSLKSEDLKTVINYIESKLQNKVAEIKPILLLELDDKVITEKELAANVKVDKKDKEFLISHFTLVTEDEIAAAKKFFATSIDNFRDTVSTVEGSSPELKYANIRETIYHDLLKKCKDFKIEKIAAPILEGLIISAVAAAAVKLKLVSKEALTAAATTIVATELYKSLRHTEEASPYKSMPFRSATANQRI
ncbi:MAG: hypothetical protein UR14_C0006G0063 [candidate division TM6 bacterium GW2011_GWE2_31_21]|nr:MAG: hypothetical protein UR14_C0006G0063 [candidate division TM6 bacterium GW2011_GWE2_31_21]KKP53514.1 MAG: hypothetical protein UR43_C0004G0055 [candidate division TM6 bacterium GW2011_GWF2_33_332]